MRRSLALFGLVALIAAGTLPTPAFARAGSLDPAFGHQGFMVFAGDPYAVTDIQVQANGRILVCGDMGGLGGATGGFAIVRLLPGGKPDDGFGSSGLATAPFGPSLNTAHSLAIQADGKIVAAGFTGLSGPSRGDAIAIVRFRPSGAIDPFFGDGGTVQFTVPGSSSSVADVVMVLADRKMLVGGQAKFSSGTSGVVIRLKPNGAIDPTFGSGGFATLASPFGVTALGLQADGKIVALTGQIAMRLRPSGSVDPQPVRGALVAEAHFGAAMLTPDEKILTALTVRDSQSQDDLDTQGFRLFPNGTNDASFASPVFDFLNSDGDAFENVPFAIALQADGSPIIAGQGQNEPTVTEGALARLTPTGALDPSFGNGGTVASTLDGDDQFSALALQPDGKIIAAGISSTPVGGLVIARYLSDSRRATRGVPLKPRLRHG